MASGIASSFCQSTFSAPSRAEGGGAGCAFDGEDTIGVDRVGDFERPLCGERAAVEPVDDVLEGPRWYDALLAGWRCPDVKSVGRFFVTSSSISRLLIDLVVPGAPDTPFGARKFAEEDACSAGRRFGDVGAIPFDGEMPEVPRWEDGVLVR
jgi:hypothetical protein